MDRLPAIINRVAPGLLFALGLQNTGRNPSALADFVQSTMDTRDWYFTQLEQLQAGNGTNVTGNGTFNGPAALTVPASEWWWIVDWNTDFTAPAATTATLCPFWAIPTTVSQAQHPSPALRLLASENIVVPGGGGFFLPPNSQPRVLASAFTGAGPITWGVRARYVRLPI